MEDAGGTEVRGCIWGPSLGAEDRVFKAFKAVENGASSKAVAEWGWKQEAVWAALLLPAKQTWKHKPAPASLVEELAQTTKRWIRHNTGDNRDKLSSVAVHHLGLCM